MSRAENLDKKWMLPALQCQTWHSKLKKVTVMGFLNYFEQKNR